MARTKSFDQEEVLNKILMMFWQKGYHQTSLQDILRAGGISKQSMYDTYGDKRTLFLKALILYREINTKAIEQRVQEELDRNTPVLEILRGMIYTSETPDGNIKGCLITYSMVEFKEADDEIRTEMNKVLLFIKEKMKILIEKGQKKGEITTKLNSTQISDVLMNARNGFQVGGFYDMPAEIQNDIADSTIDLIRA
jgi:TetR/AcrR family transcriptional regulator, transcriptional repressor for nem operon